MTDGAPGASILALRDVTVNFGNVVAIQGVAFEVERGEIVGLVGDNGAGKSTLVKVMNGFYAPGRGVMQFKGRPVRFSSPRDARSVGIETVYQDLALIPALSMWRNSSSAGSSRRQAGRSGSSMSRMREITMANLHEMGLTRLRSPDEPVDILSGGERQALAIARALLRRQPAAARRADLGAFSQGDREGVRSGADRAQGRARRRHHRPQHRARAPDLRPHRHHGGRPRHPLGAPGRHQRSMSPTWWQDGMRFDRNAMSSDLESPELALLPGLEVRRLILSREVSPREAAAACLSRIRAIDDRIRSFVTIDEDMVMAMADDVERRLKEGAALPLAGIPYALKDLTDTAGLRTTYGSRLREHNVPARDAAVARRLREAGGVLLGKTNTPEFGNRATTAYGLPGDAQTLGPRQDRRRLERRIGRSGRRLPLPDGRRLRRWGIDPDPVELLRRGRHQAVARSRLEPSKREPAGRADHSRTDRAHGERCRPNARRHGRLGARRPVRRTGPDPVLPRRERA